MTDETQSEALEPVETVEPDVTPELVSEPVRDWTDDDAEEARFFGWKAPEEWAGDKPAGYIDDPRRFMERAENFKPFKKLKERLDATERESQERIRKIEAISERALKAQRETFTRELESIQAQKLAAVETADTDAYRELDKRERAMVEASKPEPQKPQDGPDPYVVQYQASEAGAWLNNPVLRKAGHDIIQGMGLHLPTAEQIKLAETEVRKMYPGYFPAKPATEKSSQGSARVDGGGSLAGGKPASGFAKLPSEAKTAFEMFVRDGIYENTDKDRKRYADEYDQA